MLQITDKGVEIDDLYTIQNRLVSAFKSIYGENVNLDSDTPDGQLLGLFSQELANIHQAVSFIVQMLDPYQATGHWLEQRAMYAGITRITASYSYIDEVIFTGSPKTTIPNNSIYIDKNKNKWVTTEPIMLNDLGSARVKFRSLELGNYTVNALDEFTASTIIIGVDKVTANTKSYGGVDEETDAQLLKRFMLSHSINNYDDRRGIQSALMNITGVTKCVVYENYTNKKDEKGVPAHSFNAVILGGADEKIAEVITKKKIGGCGLFGEIETSYLLDDIPRRVYFDRPKKIDVNVSMVIGRYKSFNDINTEQIKTNLKSLEFEIGENVYASRIISSINLVDGFYIKELAVNGSNIANIGYREYAQINNIEVLIDE
ncbi:baseplate J/gp47 family protein [Gilliamella sp. ESL0232]|uniref:baseplate J/gp47 family protein n=1 Tax=Gilliamella sp. ESL0232 TaxID=2705037 RepID=UPI00157FC973|nr:baseplate J/gp47 family protein [Gilliamella sp. ESL0232]NUE95374.1 baseplate J/gp47 family protein [Gilliamella sp. ESL0232]